MSPLDGLTPPPSVSTPSMQAREVDVLPRGEDWIYEYVWGGERIRAVKHGARVQLTLRDGRDCTNRFPRIAAAVARLRAEVVVLDGEVLFLDVLPRPAVALLARVADDLAASEIVLLACDLLGEAGRDLRPSSLLCRRVRLAGVVQGTPILLSPLVHGSPELALGRAAKLGLRGVMAKRGGSPYRPNSLSADWVKVTLVPASIGRLLRRRQPRGTGDPRRPWRAGSVFGPS